jgi:hypothetical protein
MNNLRDPQRYLWALRHTRSLTTLELVLSGAWTVADLDLGNILAHSACLKHLKVVVQSLLPRYKVPQWGWLMQLAGLQTFEYVPAAGSTEGIEAGDRKAIETLCNVRNFYF